MIYPVKVERNEDGWWSHPAFDEMAGEREMLPADEVHAWLDSHQLIMQTVLFDEFEINGDPPALEDWELQPPGSEWFLLAVGEGEDGHFQHWARHKTPLDAIAAERLRQIEAEGWSPGHDDQHRTGGLALAAACYAYAATLPPHSRRRVSGIYSHRNDEFLREFWPWDGAWWKPTDPRRDLVKAGALILAEIERIDRAAERQGGE